MMTGQKQLEMFGGPMVEPINRDRGARWRTYTGNPDLETIKKQFISQYGFEPKIEVDEFVGVDEETGEILRQHKITRVGPVPDDVGNEIDFDAIRLDDIADLDFEQQKKPGVQ